MIDLAAVRAQTPGANSQTFLDSAGSSLPPQRVVDSVIAHVRREAEVGGYRAAAERAEDLAALPASIGRLIGAAQGTIALTDSATRAWSQFVTSVPMSAGDRVLMTGAEYASNAMTLLRSAQLSGASVEVIPSDSTGRIDLGALAAMVDERVRLVSLVHVASTSGAVNPVRQVVDVVRPFGALVVLDACQSVGQLVIDVDALGVDALSAAGRKWLRGPRGTGFLYVRPGLLEVLEPVAPDLRGGTWTAPGAYALHPDARRFELWEADIAGRLGLGEAVDLLLELGPPEVEQAVAARAGRLRGGLEDMRGVQVHDLGDPLCGIVTFTVEGLNATQVHGQLLSEGVTVAVGNASSTLIDMTSRGLGSVLRASPHYFVSDEQIDHALGAVERLTSGMTVRS